MLSLKSLRPTLFEPLFHALISLQKQKQHYSFIGYLLHMFICLSSKLFFAYTGCFKSLGHILTINISKTIKDIKTHLVNSESVLSQILHEMFKDAQCGHHWSHDTHQACSPILVKRVLALHCQWLKQLLLFAPSAHPRL